MTRGRLQFQFDANQPYQLRAIEAVADLFRGQPRRAVDFAGSSFGELWSPVANRLDLTDEQLLANLHDVQGRGGIAADEGLKLIEEHLPGVSGGDVVVRFPNFSVEMETGTGKTYVYLRTALELHRRYGLRRYIVVVPSVAVREGVLKTLRVTRDHLRAVYDNVPYRFSVYDARSIGKVRQFAQSDCVEILVMTIDSFNKDDNVIRQSTDRLQGATPIHLVQAARPVLILDEPQNMESEGRIRALASLRPLVTLRYDATYRNPYNRAYRLTPFAAYREGLVKRIEVASVVKEDDHNQVFLRLDEVRSDKRTVQAKIAVHQRMANGQIKEKAYLFKPLESLAKKTDRPQYASFVIDEMRAKYADVAGDVPAAKVRAAYFASKSRRGGASELVDSTTGNSAEDRAAYKLIMQDKERLLSFDEPIAFIFSHRALREGWDNPNVCQICTLNQTVSEVKKRQEVGRGMRLVVDQSGRRLADARANVLTVVANESYEAFGKEGAAPKPTNARAKRVAVRKPMDQLPAEFAELWDRIKHRTRYQVTVDTDRLVTEAIVALNRLKIEPPRIVSQSADVEVLRMQDRLDYRVSGKRVLARLAGHGPVPNVVEMVEDLLAHVQPPIKLTRRTIAAVVTGVADRQAALNNPQEFASQAARVLRERATHQLVDGI